MFHIREASSSQGWWELKFMPPVFDSQSDGLDIGTHSRQLSFLFSFSFLFIFPGFFSRHIRVRGNQLLELLLCVFFRIEASRETATYCIRRVLNMFSVWEHSRNATCLHDLWMNACAVKPSRYVWMFESLLDGKTKFQNWKKHVRDIT